MRPGTPWACVSGGAGGRLHGLGSFVCVTVFYAWSGLFVNLFGTGWLRTREGEPAPMGRRVRGPVVSDAISMTWVQQSVNLWGDASANQHERQSTAAG
jgi:hypothetical protein